MSTIHTAPTDPLLVEGNVSTTAWGAIAAGGVAATAVSFFMMALGVGLGFTVVSPWVDEGISASTFSLATGVYLVIMAMVASTIGGYLAGRLRARWIGVHRDEVYFRDTAHGFMAWAFGLVLTASLLGAATTHLLAGASAGSIPAAGAGAAQAASPADSYVDTLLRPNPAAQSATAPAAGDASATRPAAADMSATRGEFGRLLIPVLRRGGDLSPDNRTHMARVVAARTGLTQPEAEQRVTQVVTDAKAAADKARREAAKLSLWLAASMLAGAFAASLAAAEGGSLRDSRWYEPGWIRNQART